MTHARSGKGNAKVWRGEGCSRPGRPEHVRPRYDRLRGTFAY